MSGTRPRGGQQWQHLRALGERMLAVLVSLGLEPVSPGQLGTMTSRTAYATVVTTLEFWFL